MSPEEWEAEKVRRKESRLAEAARLREAKKAAAADARRVQREAEAARRRAEKAAAVEARRVQREAEAAMRQMLREAERTAAVAERRRRQKPRQARKRTGLEPSAAEPMVFVDCPNATEIQHMRRLYADGNYVDARKFIADIADKIKEEGRAAYQRYGRYRMRVILRLIFKKPNGDEAEEVKYCQVDVTFVENTADVSNQKIKMLGDNID